MIGYHLIYWPATFLIALALFSCAASNNAPSGATSDEKPLTSFKGWELYSFSPDTPTISDWKFVLMRGTNRVKTADEVRSQPSHGIDGLRDELLKFERGEFIMLIGYELPPSELLDEIAMACETRELHFSSLMRRWPECHDLRR